MSIPDTASPAGRNGLRHIPNGVPRPEERGGDDSTAAARQLHAARNGEVPYDAVRSGEPKQAATLGYTAPDIPHGRASAFASPARAMTPTSSFRSDAGKDWIVQKFGGTSVGKVPDVIAEGVVGAHLQDHRVALVCSARSADTKAAGTTNRLLRAAREAETLKSRRFEDTIRTIEADHLASAAKHVRSTELLAQLTAEIMGECQELVLFLEAAQKVGEVSARTRDRVVSKGENLACRFMATLLQDRGIEAAFVDLADAIDFPVGEVLDQAFYNRLAVTLAETVAGVAPAVPVVTGYFGPLPGGLLTQIGRGYTDLCAALLAVGLRASELQVWKEVDGIFTANPRQVPTAQLLPTITPAEAAELTYYGSEVIHPFTMEQVIRARIPIRIRNVLNLHNAGTRILPDAPSAPASPARSGARSPHTPASRSQATIHSRSSSRVAQRHQRAGSAHHPKRPTAITVKHNIIVLNVHSNKRTLSHGFFAGIFTVLDRCKLSVDLISTSEVHVSMALHSESAWLSSGDGADGSGSNADDSDTEIANNALRAAVHELAKFGTVDIRDGMAILSLVGRQMRNMKGIAGKMFSVLGENSVNIEMISQGASEINISCVIEEQDANRAINILHLNLFTLLE